VFSRWATVIASNPLRFRINRIDLDQNQSFTTTASGHELP